VSAEQLQPLFFLRFTVGLMDTTYSCRALHLAATVLFHPSNVAPEAFPEQISTCQVVVSQAKSHVSVDS